VLDELVRVGHSSGRALAHGLLAAARVAGSEPRRVDTLAR